MTCSEGESEVMTSVPRAFSRMCSTSSLTTLKFTSASSRAMRISLSASPIFSSVRVPCPRRFLKARWSLSVRFSNIVGIQIDGCGSAVFAAKYQDITQNEGGLEAECRRVRPKHQQYPREAGKSPQRLKPGVRAGRLCTDEQVAEKVDVLVEPAFRVRPVTLVSRCPQILLRLPFRPATTNSVKLGKRVSSWLAAMPRV